MIWSARRVSHTFSRVWCMIPERDTADSHRLAGRKRETSSSLEAADRSASVVGVQVWKRVGRASFLLPRLARSRRQGTSHGTPFPGSCRPTEKRCSHDRGNSSDFRGNRFPDRLGDQRSQAGRRTPYRFTPCALSSLDRPANTPLHPRGRFQPVNRGILFKKSRTRCVIKMKQRTWNVGQVLLNFAKKIEQNEGRLDFYSIKI